MTTLLDAHYQTVIEAITEGELVFFLGAGINLCSRPQGMEWQLGEFLPDSTELAKYLADEFHYPSDDTEDLVRLSQYAAVMRGSGPLYKKLRNVFNADYPPTPVHLFLANLPIALREKGFDSPNQLIVTTNYDDVLERAFQTVGEYFDLVSYMAEAQQRGKFIHQLPDGKVRLIEKANEYSDLSLRRRPIILKIHGAIDRVNALWDSFVITEDHYIDYLSRTDISNLIPVQLAAILPLQRHLI